MENKGTKQYDFFVSYYQATGSHFVKHLKNHSKDFNRTTFLDVEDIRSDIKRESDEWRDQIDEAIANSNNFVLVMTLGFKDRAEIKREWKIASQKGVNRFLFKKSDLINEDLLMETEDGIIDFSKWEFTTFTNEYDLLAKVESKLRGTVITLSKPLFNLEADKIIKTEGLEFKQTSRPFFEVVIGQINSDVEWLPIGDNGKFEDLLNVSPYHFPNIYRIRARRNYYQFVAERNDKEIDFFLKVTPKGYFHLIEPIRSIDNGEYDIDILLSQLFEFIIYVIQMMKYREITNNQSILILFSNVRKLKISFHDLFMSTWVQKRDFSDCDPEPFLADFNPKDDWKTIGISLKKIAKDICQELSFQSSEKQLNQRLNSVIQFNFYVTQNNEFMGSKMHIILKHIPAAEFGFS